MKRRCGLSLAVTLVVGLLAGAYAVVSDYPTNHSQWVTPIIPGWDGRESLKNWRLRGGRTFLTYCSLFRIFNSPQIEYL
mgnify:FL=1